MKIKDKLNIKESTSPRGYVIVKNTAGEVVFEKHNMIYPMGRLLLLNYFVNNIVATDVTKTIPAVKIVPYYGNKPDANPSYNTFGANTNTDFIKNRLDTVSSVSYSVTANGDYEKVNGNVYDPHADNISDVVNPSIKITFDIKPSGVEPISVSEIGLRIVPTNSPDDSDGNIFSRVVFNTVNISSADSYTVDYYIYF